MTQKQIDWINRNSKNYDMSDEDRNNMISLLLEINPKIEQINKILDKNKTGHHTCLMRMHIS